MTRALVPYAEILDGVKVEPLADWATWPQVSAQPLAHNGDPLGYVIIFESTMFGSLVFAGFNAAGELCSPEPRHTQDHAIRDIGDAIIAAVSAAK